MIRLRSDFNTATFIPLEFVDPLVVTWDGQTFSPQCIKRAAGRTYIFKNLGPDAKLMGMKLGGQQPNVFVKGEPHGADFTIPSRLEDTSDSTLRALAAMAARGRQAMLPVRFSKRIRSD